MTYYDLRKFSLANNLSQPEIADYLGVGKAFISQVERGVSKLPLDKYARLLQNDKGWDTSMLTEPTTQHFTANAKEWMPERMDSPLVFAGAEKYYTVARIISRWAKKAGINKHVTFHVSRHTFATLELTYGADLYTVSKLLGHTKIETTQIYAKIVDEKKVKAVNLIPTL